MPVASQHGPDVLLNIKAVPGAKRDQIVGVLGDRLKVRVSAPPEGGKANHAICRIIADALGLKPGAIAIERGHASAEKTLRVRGVDVALVQAQIRTEGPARS